MPALTRRQLFSAVAAAGVAPEAPAALAPTTIGVGDAADITFDAASGPDTTMLVYYETDGIGRIVAWEPA